MVQHLLLSMVAPVFLALGAPVTLALRTLSGTPAPVLLAVLHRPPARLLASPLVSLPLFMVSIVRLYFTGWYQARLTNPFLHQMQHVHFVLVGCLFFWPIFGIDPVPGGSPTPAGCSRSSTPYPPTSSPDCRS